MLAPSKYRQQFGNYLVPYPELREDISDELSDLLWYGFDVALHNHESAGELSALSIREHSGIDVTPPATFEQMQTAVMDHAADIRFEVGQKSSGNGADIVSLTESPYQAFAAAHMRLIEVLQSGTIGATDKTHDSNVADKGRIALGDYLNVLTYIAKECLGFELEDIARYNVFKLRDRKTAGKKIGHLFHEFAGQGDNR